MARPIVWILLVSGFALGAAASGVSSAEETPAREVPAQAAAAAPPAKTQSADAGDQQVAVGEARAAQVAKMTCKTVKVTGSKVRSRKVCTTPDQTAGAGEWVRQQQDRGGLEASRALNNGTN